MVRIHCKTHWNCCSFSFYLHGDQMQLGLMSIKTPSLVHAFSTANDHSHYHSPTLKKNYQNWIAAHLFSSIIALSREAKLDPHSSFDCSSSEHFRNSYSVIATHPNQTCFQSMKSWIKCSVSWIITASICNQARIWNSICERNLNIFKTINNWLLPRKLNGQSFAHFNRIHLHLHLTYGFNLILFFLNIQTLPRKASFYEK
jgi:hypothetical protein